MKNKRLNNRSFFRSKFYDKVQMKKVGSVDDNVFVSREDSIPLEEYEFLRYVDIKLWSSIYYQITEILSISLKTDSILEVGKGTGILGGVIKELGFSYESMDINPNLHPVHIGSVDNMPLGDNSYDIIGCFEVLEHLPYEKLTDALSELFRVANKAVIISLPNAKRIISFYLWIPRTLHKKLFIPIPFYKPSINCDDPDHRWEINRGKHSIRQIRGTLQKVANKCDFSLVREYRNWENSYHHFFVFHKKA